MGRLGRLLLEEIEETSVEQDSAVVWSIGGAGVVVKTPLSLIIIDPFFGSSGSSDWVRMIPAPLNPEEISFCSLFLSTHEHEDHCERKTVIAVARGTGASFIGPESSCRRFLEWGVEKSRVVTLKPGESFSLNDVAVTAWFANDPDAESAVSFIIEAAGVKLFHSGDSKFSEEFSKIGEQGGVDVAFLSLGRNPRGHKYYMNACDTVEAARDLGAQTLIPVHWDLWRRTREDPLLVKEIAERWGLRVNVVILGLGDKHVCRRTRA
ncbi:MAG: MBL fold metallo-hydrolase [Candidatus Brockarchaeota archaeon]|nr:MBL fold metallo-hydrolase [Candidatus Brockarchaeota archaeon]